MTKQILALLLSWQLSKQPKTAELKQQAYMVWNAHCIEKIEQTDKVYIEAPMFDGVPDLSQATIHGQIATYKPKCGVVEVRRVK